MRQERQGAFSVKVEQPLGRQYPFEVLQPGQQLANSDGADLAGGELQGAAFGPEGGFGLDHDPSALGQWCGHCVKNRGADRYIQRHVDVRITQGEVGGGLPWTATDLDYLAFDP